MALLFVDGFDSFGTTPGTNISGGLTCKYLAFGVHTSDTIQTGRFSDGLCLRPSNNASGTASYTSTPYFPAAATVVAGVAFRIGGGTSPGVGIPTTGVWKEIISFWSGGSGTEVEECGIQIGGTNGMQIRVFRGNGGGFTTLQDNTTPVVIDVNKWYYLEFKATIADAGSFDVYLDGVQVVFASNSGDTQQTNANCTHVRLRSRDTTPAEDSCLIDFDDFYVLNTTGAPSDFLGPQHVKTRFPDAAGDSAQFTPSAGNNYQAVDDNAHDTDSTYVESSTAAHKDLYNFASMTFSTTINAVVVSTVPRKTDATAFDILPCVKSNGVEADASAAVLVDQTTYVTNAQGFFLTDPDTAGAWTDTIINAAQFGYKVD